eukprot:201810_1
MVDEVDDEKRPIESPLKSDDDSQVEIIVVLPPECVLGEITFDPMSSAEVVATVRQLINEYPATSSYTSFLLILMTEGLDGKLVDLKEVHDYVELRSCLEESILMTVEGKEEEHLKGGGESQQAAPLAIKFRMEMEPYTLHTARHHVRHVKELLQFPPVLADGELPEDCDSSILSDVDQRKANRGKLKKGHHHNDKRKKKLHAAPVVNSSSSQQPRKLSNDSSLQQQAVHEARTDVKEQSKEFLRRFKESAVPVSKDEGLGPFYTLGLELALEEVVEPLPVPVVPEKGGESDQTFHLNVESGLAAQTEPRVKCLQWIRPSCWNPPPTQRSLVGDLMYLDVAMLDDIVIHITVTPDGFYVNKTSRGRFDPGPAFNPHFSHELLFTLMKASSSFSAAWSKAVVQARAKSSQPDILQSTLIQLVRDGCIDSVTSQPQWNVPLSSKDGGFTGASSSPSDGITGGGRRNHMENSLLNDWHAQQDDEYQSFGAIDKGAPRDWNDELQGVKDWESSSRDRRIIQARAMHKILQEFHAAAIQGAIAIVAGHVLPFNCPESEETSVFVFNNIFFSYAADTGEGYKVALGAPAAWKSLGRDLRNSACLLGMKCRDINTIATAVVDYRGRRVVAQGIIPGILRSDNKYTILLGAIEKVQKIKSDPDALELVRSIGKVFHIAERNVPDLPIQSVVDSSSSSNLKEEVVASDSISTDDDGTSFARGSFDGDVSFVPLCGPVEMKCLLGTDGRKYLLEMLRLTPRDANWVRGTKGTGVYGDMAPPRDEKSHVRLTIEDVAVLRPELISSYVKLLMKKNNNNKAPAAADSCETFNLKAKETVDLLDIIPKDGEGGEEMATTTTNNLPEGDDDDRDFTHPPQQLTSDQVKKIEELAFNVNVFMPFTACTDPKQLWRDEEHARAAAKFLWDVALPSITSEIRNGHFVSSDGVHMCEQLHNWGINLRYMGQLAQLALKEELDNAAMSTETKQNGINRFPVYWRTMLEVEMVARAAKYVFFDLLAASPSARVAPGPTVRHFLNCLVGNGSALQQQVKSTPSYSKNNGSTASCSSRKKKGNNSSSSPKGFGDVLYKAVVANSDMTHGSLWDQLREEVRDRYRYILDPSSSSGVGSQESSLQLLRRTCQRIGARILSKPYDFQESEPLGMWDIVDLVPTSKNCQPSTPFQEANDILSEAHVNLAKGNIQTAFDLTTCAAGAMEQVCSGLHRMYADILHCQGLVLYHANNIEAAIAHEQKALAFYEQVEGFDSYKVIMCHRHLSVLYASLDYSTSLSYGVRAIGHARTLCYLAELLGGKTHPDVSATYQHLGRLYMGVGHTVISMKCFEEAMKREMDANTEAHLHHYVAKVLAIHKLYKDALKQQKAAWSIWHHLYGDLHPKTQEATAYLEHYTSSAVCHEKSLIDTQHADQATAAEVIKSRGAHVKLTKKMKKKKEGAAATAVTTARQ